MISARIRRNKTLRIGIDGRVLQGNFAGTGRYVFELCKAVNEFLPDAKFFIYCYSPIRMPVVSERWFMRLDKLPIAKYLRPVIWLKTRCSHLAQQDKLDVFWGGSHFLPFLKKQVKKVLTVHDLVFQVAPKTLTFTHLMCHLLFFKQDVSRADTILANSQGTSDRLFGFLGRKADAVIYPGVNASWGLRTKEEIADCLSSYQIHSPYLLTVATLEPRKNLATLIKAFTRLKGSGYLPKHKFVLVGGKGWKDEKLMSMLTSLGHHDIMVLGYVPDQQLECLYKEADVFILPSIYEGFGIPVLEARACGTKIVTSDIQELREAGGEDAIYIEPSEEGICQGILRALEMEKKEVKPADLPSWQQGARILAEAFI